MLPKSILNTNNKPYVNMDSLNYSNNFKEYVRQNRRIDDSDESDDEYANINFEEEFQNLKKYMEDIVANNEGNNEGNYGREYDTQYDSEYLYKIQDVLTYDLTDYLKKNSLPKKVNILPYQVNNTGLKPFVQYFLRKCPDNKLSFISYEGLQKFDDIVNKCYKTLEVIFLSYMKVPYYQYKGFKIFEDELYIFYDCSRSHIGVHCLRENNDVWLTLMHEIINVGKVCNFDINNKVKNLFINNDNLIYLKNKNNMNCELPVVAYSYGYNEQIDFVSVFGVSRCRDLLEGFAGQYYYFYSYDNMLEKLKREGEKKRKGIIRIALFLGNMKVPMNLEYDEADKSEHTRDLLLKDSTATTEEYKLVRAMIKMSDRDGKWTENYDSVYVGKYNLTDVKNVNFPIWVVKEYEQQISLTYHIMKI
jgi:hypothetical protein